MTSHQMGGAALERAAIALKLIDGTVGRGCGQVLDLTRRSSRKRSPARPEGPFKKTRSHVIVVYFVYVVSSSQPDLLNFKKGWMVKLEGTEQVKHFF